VGGRRERIRFVEKRAIEIADDHERRRRVHLSIGFLLRDFCLTILTRRIRRVLYLSRASVMKTPRIAHEGHRGLGKRVRTKGVMAGTALAQMRFVLLHLLGLMAFHTDTMHRLAKRNRRHQADLPGWRSGRVHVFLMALETAFRRGRCFRQPRGVAEHARIVPRVSTGSVLPFRDSRHVVGVLEDDRRGIHAPMTTRARRRFIAR